MITTNTKIIITINKIKSKKYEINKHKYNSVIKNITAKIIITITEMINIITKLINTTTTILLNTIT